MLEFGGIPLPGIYEPDTQPTPMQSIVLAIVKLTGTACVTLLVTPTPSCALTTLAKLVTATVPMAALVCTSNLTTPVASGTSVGIVAKVNVPPASGAAGVMTVVGGVVPLTNVTKLTDPAAVCAGKVSDSTTLVCVKVTDRF